MSDETKRDLLVAYKYASEVRDRAFDYWNAARVAADTAWDEYIGAIENRNERVS